MQLASFSNSLPPDTGVAGLITAFCGVPASAGCDHRNDGGGLRLDATELGSTVPVRVRVRRIHESLLLESIA